MVQVTLSGSTCTLAVPIYSALEHTENLRLIAARDSVIAFQLKR
jgi:hypothetical protein